MKNIENYFDMLPYNGNLIRNSNKSMSTSIGPTEYIKPEPGPEPPVEDKNWFYVEDVSGENNNTLVISFEAKKLEPEIEELIITSYDFYVSNDKENWTKLDTLTTTSGPVSYEFGVSEKLYIRCNTPYTGILEFGAYVSIGCTGKYNIGGNTMSLLYGAEFTGNETTLRTHTFSYKGEDVTVAGFSYLFHESINLESAENLILPATTLAESCYGGMFSGCTSLTEAPQLPATTLSESCYSNMFYGCTSLTEAPELPATTLADSCYSSMFAGCTSLVTSPELQATTLTENCYSGMFYGCTSLTAAPELPATTLSESCYNSMFYGCTSLTEAPELPATTLADSCYSSMFYGCTALTAAPILPAKRLTSVCYSIMFNNCSSLNSITVHASEWDINCTSSWLKGVAASGTLYNLGGANIPTESASGCPEGWTIEESA